MIESDQLSAPADRLASILAAGRYGRYRLVRSTDPKRHRG